MPRYSRPQLRNKIFKNFFFHDVIHCNVIDQSAYIMTIQLKKREKRIANAAETLQTRYIRSKISACQNLHSRTEYCIPSCKPISFSINYKTLKYMSDQQEVNEQPKHLTVNNAQTLKLKTSNTSGTSSEQTPTKEKSSQPVKHKIFPFSWPEIFDSKVMALNWN